MAMFSVDADAAQRMIDYSGLQVCRLPAWPCDRGADPRALHRRRSRRVPRIQHLCDGQPARVEASGLGALQSAFVHHMLVDQAFTLEAGRTIWGFPKVMSDFTIRDGRAVRLRREHRRPARGRHGIPSRPPGSVGAHVTGAGVARVLVSRRPDTRKPLSRSRSTASRYRPGGARVRLGEHPYAKELASLGFPKRAMVSSSADNVEMSFGDAQEVRQ